LNGVDEIVNAFFYFIKLFTKDRESAAFGIELGNQHICKSVEQFIVTDELLNEQDHNFLYPFLLDGFLLARAAFACASTLVITVNFHRMTRSAFARNQTLTITAEQFCGQQIFVLRFVLCGRLLVRGGSLLHLLKQLGRNDGGDSVRNDYVTIFAWFAPVTMQTITKIAVAIPAQMALVFTPLGLCEDSNLLLSEAAFA